MSTILLCLYKYLECCKQQVLAYSFVIFTSLFNRCILRLREVKVALLPKRSPKTTLFIGIIILFPLFAIGISILLVLPLKNRCS